MATFRNAPVTWQGADVVHIASDSVWERTSKFTNCGAKIGPDAQYDGNSGGSVYDWTPLIPTCPVCISRAKRDDATQ